MAHFATELLGQFVYSPDLSYQDLIDREEYLKVQTTALLERNFGEFVQFEALGDTLRFQCVFPDYTESLFHTLCEEMQKIMDKTVEARLLFVSKDLESLHLYTHRKGTWKESCLTLPMAGPIGQALRNSHYTG